MPFYDGLPVGNSINELSPLGIPLNIFPFGIVLLIQIISLILIKKGRKSI